jgi:hypothetical protein
MIDICDAITLLPNWTDSKGARMEHAYATMNAKEIYLFGY